MENFIHYRMAQTLHDLYSMTVHSGLLGCHWTMVDTFNIDPHIENLNVDVDVNVFNQC